MRVPQKEKEYEQQKPLIAAILTLALILAIILPLPAIAQQTEGPGFSSPREAAEAYLACLKEQNLNKMLSVFAIESWVEQTDFEKTISLLGAYSYTQPLMPNAGSFAKQLNIEARRASVISTILNQFLFYNAPEQFNDFRPTGQLSDPAAREAFIASFKTNVRESVFKDLRVTGEANLAARLSSISSTSSGSPFTDTRRGLRRLW